MICYYHLELRIKTISFVDYEIKHFLYGYFIRTFLYLSVILNILFWREIYLSWLIYHKKSRNRSVQLNKMLM